MKRIINEQEELLLYIFNLPQEEIRKHNEYVFEWSDIFFEVLPKEKATFRKTKASHYVMVTHNNKTYYIREMGNKSQKVIKIKKHERTT